MEQPIAASTCSEEQIELLKVLLGQHMIRQTSDIHIRGGNVVNFRSRNVVLPACNWPGFTDKDGAMLNGYSYAKIADLLLGENKNDQSSRVFRTKAYQIRVQPLMGVNEKKLIIRIQPISPPSLTHILKDHPKLIETLTSASGLVVLCGPVGSGKTTTAAALVSHWANRRSKHIATIEDPVEYIITPQAGEVTHMSCNLLGQDRPEGVPDLRRLLATLVRGDIDGLFIGEIRDSETRRVCLAHAATSEPVVTTIHAGGIGHAALRLTGSEPGVTEGEQGFLRLSLTQCLHTIIYINLAYNEKGEAVPVVIAAPAKMTALRNAIVSSDPKTLTNQVNQAVLTVTDEEGGISPARAMASARALGATEASIIAALPGDLRALMNQSR